MTARSARRRRFWIVAVVAVVAVAALSGFAWVVLTGFTTREEVEVARAEYVPDRQALMLIVGTCQGDPELIRLEETDSEVHVAVVSTVPHFRGGGDCLDVVDVQLRQPLAERLLVDLTTAKTVRVQTIKQTG